MWNEPVVTAGNMGASPPCREAYDIAPAPSSAVSSLSGIHARDQWQRRLVMQTIFMAHSGLRYLVLLVGVVAVVYFAYAVAKGGNPRTSRVVASIFTGVLDLQILLGLILVALGLYYPALLGHLFMMLFAAVTAHVAMVMAKSSPDAARANRLRLAGVVLALLLIAGGVMAIGRGLLESGAPSIS